MYVLCVCMYVVFHVHACMYVCVLQHVCTVCMYFLIKHSFINVGREYITNTADLSATCWNVLCRIMSNVLCMLFIFKKNKNWRVFIFPNLRDFGMFNCIFLWREGWRMTTDLWELFALGLHVVGLYWIVLNCIYAFCLMCVYVWMYEYVCQLIPCF